MKSQVLKNKKEFFISPSSPFHFDGTFHKPSHYPDRLDDWESGKYWQAIRIGKRLFGLKIENKGETQKPKIKVSVFHDNKISESELEKIKREIIWRFDLDADLKEFNKLAKSDKRFYPIFKKWLGMRNSSAHNLYELLIIAVLLQNATVRRTVQMTNVLLDNYGAKLKFDGKDIFTIWLPEKLNNVSEKELRDLKIGYRAKFIKRLSQDFAEGKIDELELRTLDQESARKELIKLYGVGPETARILLFEVCHQYDIFDHIAPWQQKIYSRLFYKKPLVPVNKIREDIKKQYGDYSMLAVHYIWEDIFWKRKNERIEWLEKEIRL
jgi:3-methyladenine DNA glycosylase/8-oxoguanine DNA glycosylase